MRLLPDTGVWIRAMRGDATAAGVIASASAAGSLVTCAPVRLELLRGIGGPRRVADVDRRLKLAEQVRVGEEAWDRADDVVRGLAALVGGRHRGPSVSDLLIAAVAEQCDATVLHCDFDFETIAEITGQPTSRLLSR